MIKTSRFSSEIDSLDKSYFSTKGFEYRFIKKLATSIGTDANKINGPKKMNFKIVKNRSSFSWNSSIVSSESVIV